jgi:hypothetical protein
MRQAPHGMVVRGTRYAPRTKVLLIRTRVSLLRAAVGFALVSPTAPELRLLHRWLDSWSGVGYVVAGMARQEYDLELRRYNGRGWRAMFFPSGFEHSFTSHAGSGWAASPWQAVQHAAQDALDKLQSSGPPTRDWTTTDDRRGSSPGLAGQPARLTLRRQTPAGPQSQHFRSLGAAPLWHASCTYVTPETRRR